MGDAKASVSGERRGAPLTRARVAGTQQVLPGVDWIAALYCAAAGHDPATVEEYAMDW